MLSNFGIGTTTPSQALTVNGNMNLSGAFFDSTNASGTAGMVLLSTGTSTTWVSTSSLNINGSMNSGVAGQLAYWTSPSVIGSLATGTPGLFLRASSTSPTGFDWAFASSSSISQWNTNGSNIYYDEGDVGIGTSTPSSALDVIGMVTVDNVSSHASSSLTLSGGDVINLQSPNGMQYSNGNNIESYLNNNEIYFNFSDPTDSNAGASLDFYKQGLSGNFKSDDGSSGSLTINNGETYSGFYNGNDSSYGSSEVTNSGIHLSFNNSSNGTLGDSFVYPFEFGGDFQNGSNSGHIYAEDTALDISGTDINGGSGIHSVEVSPNTASIFRTEHDIISLL